EAVDDLAPDGARRVERAEQLGGVPADLAIFVVDEVLDGDAELVREDVPGHGEGEVALVVVTALEQRGDGRRGPHAEGGEGACDAGDVTTSRERTRRAERPGAAREGLDEEREGLLLRREDERDELVGALGARRGELLDEREH